MVFFFFFFNDTATTEIYTLSLHDALPICHLTALLRHIGPCCQQDFARIAAHSRMNLSGHRQLALQLLVQHQSLLQRGALCCGQLVVKIIKKLVWIHYSETWKASYHRFLHATMKSKIGAECDICSLRRWHYNRFGGRKRSERGAAPWSDLASCFGRPRCVRGVLGHFSSPYSVGNRTADRTAVRYARKFKDRFSPGRQSFWSSDSTKPSRHTDRSIRDRIDRHRLPIC